MSDVYLDTKNRQNPFLSSPNDCQVPVRYDSNFSSRPEAGGYTVVLMDVKVKYSWYGIDSTNNTITGNNNGLFTATITPGIYSGVSLAAELTTILNAATSGWTVTFNQAQQTFTYTNTAHPFTFFASQDAFTAEEPLGLRNGQDAVSIGVGTYTLVSPFVIDTNHIDFAYVYVDWPGIGGIVSAAKDEGNNNIVGGKVPVVCYAHTPNAWGQNCTVELLSESRWHSSIIPNQVTMRLYDHDWNLVDTKGQNWSVHFKLYDLPGQAKSVNHTTEVRHNDQILSNAVRDDSGISSNVPMDPRRGSKRAWEQPGRAAPLNEGPPQKRSMNVLSFPNTNFGQ